MESALISPANATVFGIPTVIFSVLIPVVGVALFTYIMAQRVAPLVLANPDYRFDRIGQRLWAVFKLWLGQLKQPRYRVGGLLHIMLFAGFIILSIRSLSLVFLGVSQDFVVPGFGGGFGRFYSIIKDYAVTTVFIAAVVAAVRRAFFKPDRYKVPPQYGKDHTPEAIFILGMICGLLITESLYEASAVSANQQMGMHAELIAPLSLAWFFKVTLTNVSIETLQGIHLAAYYLHDLIFFSFLCILPLGKHFHVITSLFNVYFLKLNKGSVKPVKWGVPEDKLLEIGRAHV